MRIFTIAALAALSLNSYAVEYIPDTDVEYDIIQIHDTTTWAKVCQSYDGTCDVPTGTYQVKVFDRNWNVLDVLRDVSVRDSGSDGVHAPDLTAEVCALYQVLDDQSLLGSLSIPAVCKIYSVGDTGPGGGIVFYVSDGGRHGLEAAPVDQANAQWCPPTTTDIEGVDNITFVGTFPDSHTGAHNTPLIEALCGASSAAGVAAPNVWPNGQSDGFLPNKEELNLLYLQMGVVGGFANALYWSSSEAGAYGSSAWYQSFINGYQGGYTKYGTYYGTYGTVRVRAVRAF